MSAAVVSAAAAATSSSSSSKRSIYNDTALHVLKGAIVRVLGPTSAITHSVSFVHATKGELVVSYQGDTLTPETVQAIQAAANAIIEENLPVETLHMGRAQAEAHYTAHPVNHTYIYDKFPIPDTVQELVLCHIPGVNINCCPALHTKTTGELKKLVVIKTKNKVKKGEYEFEFVVHDAALDYLAKVEANAIKSNKVGASKKAEEAAKSTPATAASMTAASTTAIASSTTATTTPSTSASSTSASASPATTATSSPSPFEAFANWLPGSRTHIQLAADDVMTSIVLPQLAAFLSKQADPAAVLAALSLDTAKASAAAAANAAKAAKKKGAVDPAQQAVQAAQAAQAAQALADAQRVQQQLVSQMRAPLERSLTMFSNLAYTHGVRSEREHTTTPVARLL